MREKVENFDVGYLRNLSFYDIMGYLLDIEWNVGIFLELLVYKFDVLI